MGYTPPAGTEAYAALVQENALGLAYAYFDYGGGAFAQSFWPASTVKLLSSLAALDWVGSQGFSGAATVKWDSGFSDTVNAIVDRAIRISSNEDYDRTIRIAGFDQLNAVWLSPERGFPETTIKAAYAGFEVKNPPGYTLTEGGNVKVIPPRAATGSYPCASGKNNCANLFELTEAVRRVVLRELIPAGERFDLAPADLIVLDDALCKATPSFFAKGVSAALGPGASICHKPGWVPGSDSLDHGVIEAADGRRFLLAAAVLVDVIARYFLNYSIPGLYELMQLGLVIIVYFGIAYAQQKGDHVRIELLDRDTWPGLQKALLTIGEAAGATFCALVFWRAGQNALVAWETGDTMSGLIPWPTWPAVAAVPLGFLLLGLRLLFDMVKRLRGESR